MSITFAHGERTLESVIQKTKPVFVDVSTNRELGWLKKEAEESEKTYIQLRELLKIKGPSSTNDE